MASFVKKVAAALAFPVFFEIPNNWEVAVDP